MAPRRNPTRDSLTPPQRSSWQRSCLYLLLSLPAPLLCLQIRTLVASGAVVVVAALYACQGMTGADRHGRRRGEQDEDEEKENNGMYPPNQ